MISLTLIGLIKLQSYMVNGRDKGIREVMQIPYHPGQTVLEL